MKPYKIPVTWTMYGYYEVEAESLGDAVNEVIDFKHNMAQPLPADGEYVEESLSVDPIIFDEGELPE